MNQEINTFLELQQVGVLAVEMLDGSPHGATVHFAHSDRPLRFYFETSPSYRKVEALTGRDQSRATFVVGTQADSKQTLQLDGIVKLLDPKDMELFTQVYFAKFPLKKEKFSNQILFEFHPTWWRFTDWAAPQGKQIWTSEE